MNCKHKIPKDECPVCEAMKALKGVKYERQNRQNKDHKKCESEGLCGDGCKNKGCSC